LQKEQSGFSHALPVTDKQRQVDAGGYPALSLKGAREESINIGREPEEGMDIYTYPAARYKKMSQL